MLARRSLRQLQVARLARSRASETGMGRLKQAGHISSPDFDSGSPRPNGGSGPAGLKRHSYVKPSTVPRRRAADRPSRSFGFRTQPAAPDEHELSRRVRRQPLYAELPGVACSLLCYKAASKPSRALDGHFAGPRGARETATDPAKPRLVSQEKAPCCNHCWTAADQNLLLRTLRRASSKRPPSSR